MKYLSDIIEGLAFTELQGSADTWITAVVFDSRKVVPGCLFVAVKGTQSDGHDFICLLYTSPSPRDGLLSRMPSSA